MSINWKWRYRLIWLRDAIKIVAIDITTGIAALVVIAAIVFAVRFAWELAGGLL